jgi:hypothetical protein
MPVPEGLHEQLARAGLVAYATYTPILCFLTTSRRMSIEAAGQEQEHMKSRRRTVFVIREFKYCPQGQRASCRNARTAQRRPGMVRRIFRYLDALVVL